MLLSICSSLLEDTYAFDVGASYFPHIHWNVIRNSTRSTWVSADPNADNLSYLSNWEKLYCSKLLIVPYGLSGTPGSHVLYKTNIDSGSSLYEPKINSDWLHRVDEAYYFPFVKKDILCKTLNEVVDSFENFSNQSSLWIKLDTQGSELEILKGLDLNCYRQNIVVIEVECTLQRIPIMSNSAKISELVKFLENQNMEIAVFDPIQAKLPFALSPLLANKRYMLNECDIVFTLSPSFALSYRPLGHNLSLISAYISYKLYYEACHHAKLTLKKFKNELDNSTALSLKHLLSMLGSAVKAL